MPDNGTSTPLSDSARRILQALSREPLTFDVLRTQVRPMSDVGITTAMLGLDRAGCITYLDGQAVITAAGRKAIR